MFKFFAKTTKSYLKEKNEDALLINNTIINDLGKGSSIKEDILLAIADGVGGSKYGEIASNYILKQLSENRKLLSHQIILNIIKNTHTYLQKTYNYQSLTVITVVWINKENIFIYHVGDTRVYLMTKRNFIQLTNDHTYVQELVDKGVLSDNMKSSHTKKNIITQAVGGRDELKIDIYKGLIEPEQKLLLTTDGIHDYINDKNIYKILSKSNNLEKNVDELINFAKENSSKDDISALVLYYK
ncbi:MAG: protein phosphatase 2C domain-containing protein [Halarcobacter sp.]